MLAAAEQFLARPVETAELLNVKFQVVILPGAELELIHHAPKTGGRLQAMIHSARRGFTLRP